MAPKVFVYGLVPTIMVGRQYIVMHQLSHFLEGKQLFIIRTCIQACV